MTTTPMSAEDIVRTYGDTWVGMRDGDKVKPVFIVGAMEDDEGFGTLRTSDDCTIELDAPDLVLTYPDVGMVYVADKLFWLSRKNQRQWHRGVRDYSLTIRRMEMGRSSTINLSPSLVHAMYNPEYTHKLELGAISRDFGMDMSRGYTNPILYYRGIDVGELVDGQVALRIPQLKAALEEAVHESIRVVRPAG